MDGVCYQIVCTSKNIFSFISLNLERGWRMDGGSQDHSCQGVEHEACLKHPFGARRHAPRHAPFLAVLEEHFQKVIPEGQNFHMVILEGTNLSINDTKKIMRTQFFMRFYSQCYDRAPLAPSPVFNVLEHARNAQEACPLKACPVPDASNPIHKAPPK